MTSRSSQLGDHRAHSLVPISRVTILPGVVKTTVSYILIFVYLWVGNSAYITPSWSEVEVKIISFPLEPWTDFHGTFFHETNCVLIWQIPQRESFLQDPTGSSPNAASSGNPSLILTSSLLPCVACFLLPALWDSADISWVCAGSEMKKAESSLWMSSPDLFSSIEWKCFKLG